MTDYTSMSAENLDERLGKNVFLLLLVEGSNANCWGW